MRSSKSKYEDLIGLGHPRVRLCWDVDVAGSLPCSPRAVETKKKAVERLEEQLMKLEVQATDREENKQIALGTSKLNYLDPRISVAW